MIIQSTTLDYHVLKICKVFNINKIGDIMKKCNKINVGRV